MSSSISSNFNYSHIHRNTLIATGIGFGATLGFGLAIWKLFFLRKDVHAKLKEGNSELINVLNKVKNAAASEYGKRQGPVPKNPRLAESIASTRDFLNIALDEGRFVNLLEKLIGESKHVQNFPPDLIPQEDKVVQHLLEELKPYKDVLKVEVVSYAKGRSNVIITYPGTGFRTSAAAEPTRKSIAFVGSHLDVVPADPDTWELDPFKLIVDGDKLCGRGVTDCLGHVALITCFFIELAKQRPTLKSDISTVFIASEENDSIKGVGIDALKEQGKLQNLLDGVVLWVDASDSEPCMGTAGAFPWKMTAIGKRFHSGLPHNAINPIELGAEALAYVQRRFYKDFPPHPEEDRYLYATPSTMKPTQTACASGSLNQIPPTSTTSGDIRLTPFYDPEAMMAKVESYVADLNKDLDKMLPHRGPVSRYSLPLEEKQGKIKFEWLSKSTGMAGIACNIDSPGFYAINAAFQEVKGASSPYSINGSLPLVREMQQEGFDLQITGFGLSKAYHADNEYGLLSDFVQGCKVLSSFVSKTERAFDKTVEQQE